MELEYVDVETTVYLVKDLALTPLPLDGLWMPITAEDVALSWSPDCEPKLIGIGSVWDYFQQVKIDLPNTRFLHLGGYTDHKKGEINFHAYVCENFANELCQTLWEPFLQIRLKFRSAKNGDGAGGTTLDLERRLNLKDKLIYSKRQDLLSAPAPIQGRAKCDIILGWTVALPAKPIMATGIKMDATTFIKNLFENEATKELTLVAGNGVEVKCHGNVFAAHSPALAALIPVKSDLQKSQSGRITMRNNSGKGLHLLLQYLYGMELNASKLSCDLALELFRTAQEYDLVHLRSFLCELFLQKDLSWLIPKVALEVYLYVKGLTDFENLKEHSLSIMSRFNMDVLKSCEAYTKLDPSEANELCRVVRKQKEVDFDSRHKLS